MNSRIESLLKMGWYLDTSLFMDFIERNVRTANKTSEIHDGRILIRISGGKNKGSKKSKRVFVPIIKGNRRYQFELTENINTLRNIQLTHNLTYLFSELVKAEVFRKLRKENLQINEVEIKEWWNDFCFILMRYENVKIDFEIGEELSDLALSFPIEKNAQDYIHLLIAKEKNLAFITSDKLDGQINELRKYFYQYIFYWPEIKDLIPLNPVFLK